MWDRRKDQTQPPAAASSVQTMAGADFWARAVQKAVRARWRYDLTPEGDGTRLRYTASMGPGFSFLVVAIDQQPEKASRIIERRIEGHHANMVRTLEGIAAVAEGRA